jgi:hypothetical protein
VRRGRRMHRTRPERSGGVREHLHRPADPRRDLAEGRACLVRSMRGNSVAVGLASGMRTPFAGTNLRSDFSLVARYRALKSFGTSPNARSTTASEKSPNAGSRERQDRRRSSRRIGRRNRLRRPYGTPSSADPSLRDLARSLLKTTHRLRSAPLRADPWQRSARRRRPVHPRHRPL